MKQLILIDGHKGSGKSTLGEMMAECARKGWHWEHYSAVHLEPDHFFIDKEGVLKIDRTRMSEANTWCKVNSKAAMKRGDNMVVISHHFPDFWHKKYYLELAKQYGYEIKEIFLKGTYTKPEEKLIEENTVPLVEPAPEIGLEEINAELQVMGVAA